MTDMKAPDWRPSIASYLLALSSQITIRPLARVLPPNAYGIAVLDRVLRIALATSWPRRGVTVEQVDAQFAGSRICGEWVTSSAVDPHAPPVLYIHGGAYSMCSPGTRLSRVS